jgi:hypothetical protein
MFRHQFSTRSSAVVKRTRPEVNALQSTPGASVAEEYQSLAGMQQQLSSLTDAELETITGGWRIYGPLWGTIEVAEA